MRARVTQSSAYLRHSARSISDMPVLRPETQPSSDILFHRGEGPLRKPAASNRPSARVPRCTSQVVDACGQFSRIPRRREAPEGTSMVAKPEIAISAEEPKADKLGQSWSPANVTFTWPPTKELQGSSR